MHHGPLTQVTVEGAHSSRPTFTSVHLHLFNDLLIISCKRSLRHWRSWKPSAPAAMTSVTLNVFQGPAVSGYRSRRVPPTRSHRASQEWDFGITCKLLSAAPVTESNRTPHCHDFCHAHKVSWKLLLFLWNSQELSLIPVIFHLFRSENDTWLKMLSNTHWWKNSFYFTAL